MLIKMQRNHFNALLASAGHVDARYYLNAFYLVPQFKHAVATNGLIMTIVPFECEFKAGENIRSRRRPGQSSKQPNESVLYQRLNKPLRKQILYVWIDTETDQMTFQGRNGETVPEIVKLSRVDAKYVSYDTVRMTAADPAALSEITFDLALVQPVAQALGAWITTFRFHGEQQAMLVTFRDEPKVEVTFMPWKIGQKAR